MNLSNRNILNFDTKRLIRLQFIGMEKNKVVLKANHLLTSRNKRDPTMDPCGTAQVRGKETEL